MHRQRGGLFALNTASIGRRRCTRATHYLTRIVLYKEVDAQCDKLHGQARRSNPLTVACVVN